MGARIAPIKAPRPGSEPRKRIEKVAGCSALNTALAIRPTMISIKRPPRKPRMAPAGIMAMIIAGCRFLVAGEFGGKLSVDMSVCLLVLDVAEE
jgi:hypothetical protein